MAPNIMDNGTGDNMIGQVFGVSGPVIIAERMAGMFFCFFKMSEFCNGLTVTFLNAVGIGRSRTLDKSIAM